MLIFFSSRRLTSLSFLLHASLSFFFAAFLSSFLLLAEKMEEKERRAQREESKREKKLAVLCLLSSFSYEQLKSLLVRRARKKRTRERDKGERQSRRSTGIIDKKTAEIDRILIPQRERREKASFSSSSLTYRLHYMTSLIRKEETRIKNKKNQDWEKEKERKKRNARRRHASFLERTSGKKIQMTG